jgi:dihydroxyacid dehydratase/phosphogluconate dehydratase
MADIYKNGGVKQIMKNIEHLLHTDRLAVDGKIKDRLE